MPSKKKKYNARFPAGRIKKIMQTDEEIGKVAQAVPVIISRTLELFIESLLARSVQITQARNAKTLTPSHMKQCILSDDRFDFLKDLVKDIPDASAQEDNENNAIFEASVNSDDGETILMDTDSSSSPNPDMSTEVVLDQPSSSNRTPVIRYGPKVTQGRKIKEEKIKHEVIEVSTHKANSTVGRRIKEEKIKQDVAEISTHHKANATVGRRIKDEKNNHEVTEIPVPQLVPATDKPHTIVHQQLKLFANCDNIPPLVPITPHNLYIQSSGDNLFIDEDYDN